MDGTLIKELKGLIPYIEKVIDRENSMEKEGDTYPSQKAMVLTGKGTSLTVSKMTWGFPRYDGKGLIINARSETIMEKRMFQDSVLHRRCVIPALQYYEWDKTKTKVTFSKLDCPVIYMAGIYQQYEEEERFVILTTEANESVKKVHNRMPLILEESEVKPWIYEQEMTDYLLHKVPLELKRYQEFEQQTFDFL